MTKQGSILIVDDEIGVRESLRMILKPIYEVHTAADGQEALECIRKEKIDLVTLDLRMPGLTGIDVLREIKKIDPTIEVLIVTGYPDIENFRQAIVSQGAFDYIIKPFSVPEIIATVRNALLKRQALFQKTYTDQELEKKLMQTEKGFEIRTRQLREWQIKYRQIIENSNDMILVVQDEKIKFANPKTMELSGYTEEEIEHIPAFQIIHPEDRQRVAECDARILRGEDCPPMYPFRTLRKNRESFWVEANSIRTIWEVNPAIIKFIRDISARKKAEEELRKAYDELKETQGKLIQSEKMAAVGRFSAGITHEIKNPLSIILGGTDFLLKKLSGVDGDVTIALQKIKEAILHADHILMGLLKFSQPSKLVKEKINPMNLINDTLSLLKFRLPFKNIRMITQFSEEALTINVDKSQIQQVLMNVFLNAAEAMAEEEKIFIKTYKENPSPSLGGKPACVIQIVDTGEGIFSEDLSKIFEPFFTTKRDRKGTGLGLPISKMIVENHEGNLLIQSEKGKGTEVSLILPLDEGELK